VQLPCNDAPDSQHFPTLAQCIPVHLHISSCIIAFYCASSCFIAHLRILMHLRVSSRIITFYRTSLHFMAHHGVLSHIFAFYHTSSRFMAHLCISLQEHPSIIQPIPWCVAFHLLLYLTMFGIIQLLFRYGPLHYITYILRVLPICFRALGRRLCVT
jgi:hypothetical protein